MDQTYASWPQRIAGLMARERQTRFAGGSLGYLWAYVTPVAWIAFVVGLFILLGRVPPIYTSLEVFIATGILPYIVFRQTITSMTRSVAAGRYLMYVQPMGLDDILTASALLELVNTMTMAVLIFGLLIVLFDAPLPANITEVILGLTLAWGMAACVGRLLGLLALMSDGLARSIPLLLRPLFWLSGIFYTATELPGSVQALLWFSPTLHITEIVREGYVLGYDSPIADPLYPLTIAAAFLIASVPLARFISARRLSRYRL